jgi:hypothetical protein
MKQPGMKAIAPMTHALIDAVRRRIFALRIAESVAVGCAAAAVAGLLLLPIVWWRGRSALSIAEALLGLGAVCGLLRALTSRPTRLDAAAQADRQLHLHDLLGTVLLLCRGGDGDLTTPQWRQTLLAVSETRCRDLRASDVIINRLGLRTWGGIAVLVAGWLTLSLLCAQPPDLRASARLDARSAPNLNPSATPDAQNLVAQSVDLPGRPPGEGGADQEFDRDHRAELPSPDSTSSSTLVDNASNGAHRSGAQAGVGAGLARTATASHTDLSPDRGGDPAAAAGPSATGAGRADPNARGIGASGNSATSAGESASARIPPWQAPQWIADTDAAKAAIDSGRVPDSAADLVRDYFQRD